MVWKIKFAIKYRIMTKVVKLNGQCTKHVDASHSFVS